MAGGQQPADTTWQAAVHASAGDNEPIGAAVVVDTDKLLTCAHVVVSADGTARRPLWVSFPMTDGVPRRRVAELTLTYDAPVRDLALLIIEEPVPPGVEPAPVRTPRPSDLLGKGWWAFGFPDRDLLGNSADGAVGEALGHGWIRLDTGSRYPVRPGFSGAGLWSADYQAVVGIVGQSQGNGDGRAISMHQAFRCFPEQELEVLAAWTLQAASEVDQRQWGWTLARDPQGPRHWRPRARGVSIQNERGFRFRGRTAALSQVVRWLDRAEPDRRVLVVTGSPGVGKSAVLGRIITTADAGVRQSLPPEDRAVKASLGSVSCAVHAKGKTALEVAEEIARAASASLPGKPGDLAPVIREVLREPGGRKFNVIIDALDEAAGPDQARVIMDEIVLPLIKECSEAGAQVVVGTRRRDDGGELLDRFGDVLDVLDLDDPQYFAEEDLAEYALACLRFAGRERPDNSYTDERLAAPLANQIAAMSGRNFLVAGLIARSHGLHDQEAADPALVAFPATVDMALADYLERLGPVAGIPARSVLTALAFAEAPGLPAELWRLALEAIEGKVAGEEDLARFARSAAANALIEAGGDAPAMGRPGVPVYRLFHQALNDALLRARSEVAPRAADERALTLLFVGHGRRSGWDEAPGYLLRSLPAHASRAHLVDDLLTEDAYLLHADLRRLLQVADQSGSEPGRRRAQLLWLTPRAVTATPRDRAALFSVTEVMDGLGTVYRGDDWPGPFKALWSSVRPRTLRQTVMEGHQAGVNAVCTVMVGGRELLASAGDDGTVRIWDPQTGEQRTVCQGRRESESSAGPVYGICPVTVDGRTLLASAGGDGTVRIWDPDTGEQRAVLKGRRGWINMVCGLCPVTVDGRTLLATAEILRTIRIWDPQAGEQRAVLKGHQYPVTKVLAICPVTVDGQPRLASAGDDWTVRIWDPRTGQRHAVLGGHHKQVNGVCPVTVDGRPMVASAGDDRTVRIWDLRTGQQHAVLDGHEAAVCGVCPVTVNDQQLLVSAGLDRTVRIWDPCTGEQHAVLRGHPSAVRAVCPVTVNDQQLLASAGDDGTVRIWDPRAGQQAAVPEGQEDQPKQVREVCQVTVNGRPILASANSDGTVRTWDPHTGQQLARLDGHQAQVHAVCQITMDGRTLLAGAGGKGDATVRIWDLHTGEQRVVLAGGERTPTEIWGVCPVTVNDQQLLAIAGSAIVAGVDDGTVQIWDPGTGQQRVVMKTLGLSMQVTRVLGVCTVEVDGRTLLASAGGDRRVRIWDPRTGKQRAVLKGHRGRLTGVSGVCTVTVDGRPLLASAGHDQTVRIWEPRTGEQRAVLEGHRGPVLGVCPVIADGRTLLASAGDRTVRIWDPASGLPLVTIPTHYSARAVAQVADVLAIGLEVGILVVKLSLDT